MTGIAAQFATFHFEQLYRGNFVVVLNTKIGCSLLFAVCVSLAAYSFWGNKSAVGILTGEDGFIETISAISFLTGSIVAAIAWYRGRYVVLSAIWVVLCFVFLGEETSWFQRYLNYSVPQVEAINEQGEFNIHNLYVFKPYQRPFEEILAGNGGGTTAMLMRMFHPQNLFNMGFGIYFLLIPIVLSLGWLDWLQRWIALPRMDLTFLTTIWMAIAVTVAMSVSIDPADVRRQYVQEIREMMCALFICIHTAVLAFADRLQPLFGSSSSRAKSSVQA